ncbi:GNAT family N-acetyltransferase [Rhodobacter capsulatus]|uniref:Ribosomal-protein-alanine N-acetyltransferase n=1 Tax=Rhodobacter capsulatus (strain ATCC BAA-309 / NBRC 16581 / SB1003) TaxID=272942 RepID=D5AQM9_RHOCB|nr:GNAT family protein [Rhodobacter capsulatus]ADE86818.1 ribosomal-protein-alanine N-acetyltransferase [Rhodobacter capsulatus SB 1003]ETD00363.1 GCN5 family N-acetyltransferase [Rhodobacter capsulatus DE442]ETD74703.1 GCN5 family N-acetyltransferase [Rhodobacter capsulatus R121]ETD83767.1 GCN5 family N-acetyltransferase [Rhodobacter capsulatus YW1]ETD87462.1 GCN5 family N-acetyltransferase [Rhodobacter capsulatus B6]
MFLRRRKPQVETERMTLRLPLHSDFRDWASLRAESRDFLTPWEPSWSAEHLGRKAFANRVYWAARAEAAGTALPFFLIERATGRVLGAITLDNIRRGPAQAGTLGYWVGARYARQGFMREAIAAVVDHAFGPMDLSRIEAACLPENAASRGVLEKSGFKYEGVSQAYLQINGRWRNHVLYANLRPDRRGRTDIG